MEKAKNIFNVANLYARSSDILIGCQEDKFQIVPSNVLAALSLELYVKCIYRLEKGIDFKINNKNSHDFYKAFCSLSEDTQSYITSQFDEKIDSRNMEDIKQLENWLSIKVDLNIKSVLKVWSKVFVDLRYIYELTVESRIGMHFYPELRDILSIFILRKLDLKQNGKF